MPSLSRRKLLSAAAVSAAAPFLSVPTAARAPPRAAGPLVLDDASRLNATKVMRNAVIRAGHDDHLFENLRALLKDAAAENRPLCFGGARHSMGGQSLPPDGFAAALTSAAVLTERNGRIYRPRAGARWRDVIRVLDRNRQSVAVMQSNNDFSVGGTLSVNAHGWPVRHGPFGSTVRSFRMMLADGTVLTCSREENAELFRLAIGGYGLFGIILDVVLDVAENVLMERRQELIDADRFGERFVAAATDPATRMAYGRLSVASDQFLRHAALVAFRPIASQPETLPGAQVPAAYSFLSRKLFRAQIGSDQAKKARWYAETVLLPRVATRPITRNTILNYPVSALAGENDNGTDILHEYFIAPERFADFLAACRETIPAHKQDLLNVTLRYVDADTDSVLAYAPGPRIAAVMLFVYRRTTEADEAMRRMTERLIDQVLAIGGGFYLPYRLHARPDQVRAAYPRLDEAIARKRHYDPRLRFRNLMWGKYFA